MWRVGLLKLNLHLGSLCWLKPIDFSFQLPNEALNEVVAKRFATTSRMVRWQTYTIIVDLQFKVVANPLEYDIDLAGLASREGVFISIGQ
jgi:hypothetical protein